MKVLLVNPVTSEKKMYTSTPNLGLAYIASSLRQSGHEVSLFDGMKKGITKKNLEDCLRYEQYDAAGIQVYSCSVKEAKDSLRIIKDSHAGAVTIAGGAHPSCDPENVLTELDADFAFRGEAEEGLPLLLENLGSNRNMALDNIPNLIWRTNGGSVSNPLQAVHDIDGAGLPAWDLIQPAEYPDAPIGGFVRNLPLATISCSRGCVHRCTYCANALIMGRKLRTRKSSSILDEVKLLYHKYGVRELQIIDDCFTSSRALARSVCKGIIESAMDVSISFPNGIRVDSLDEELVHLLEKAGCYSLGLGIESGSQRIVDHMKRGQKLEMIEEKINLVKRVSKIRLSGFFIVGYPEEREGDILKTISMAKKLPLNRAQFTVWMPVPGSEMTEKLTREGRLDHLQLSRVALQQINYVPDSLSLGRLKGLLRKAYIEFYLRPRILLGLMREIRSFEQFGSIMNRIKRSFFLNG